MIWTLALAALLVLPIASLTVPAWKVPLISPPSADTASELTKVSEDFAVAPPNLQVNADHATRQAASATFETAAYSPWLGWILSVWVAGSMLMAARIGVGEVRVRRLARRSRLLDTNLAKSNLENVRLRLHINRSVELRASPEIAIPFTRGVFHPTVFLPTEAHQWTPKQCESVLAHELAHVKRYSHRVWNIFR